MAMVVVIVIVEGIEIATVIETAKEEVIGISILNVSVVIMILIVLVIVKV